MRSYVLTCRECGMRRTFRYRETASIAGRVHADMEQHDVKVAYFEAYRWHETVIHPRPRKEKIRITVCPSAPRLPCRDEE